jgi:hypothetical protein
MAVEGWRALKFAAQRSPSQITDTSLLLARYADGSQWIALSRSSDSAARR